MNILVDQTVTRRHDHTPKRFIWCTDFNQLILFWHDENAGSAQSTVRQRLYLRSTSRHSASAEVDNDRRCLEPSIDCLTALSRSRTLSPRLPFRRFRAVPASSPYLLVHLLPGRRWTYLLIKLWHGAMFTPKTIYYYLMHRLQPTNTVLTRRKRAINGVPEALTSFHIQTVGVYGGRQWWTLPRAFNRVSWGSVSITAIHPVRPVPSLACRCMKMRKILLSSNNSSPPR